MTTVISRKRPAADAASKQSTADAASKQSTADAASKQSTADAASKQPAADAASKQPTADAASKRPTADAAFKQPTADAASKQPTADAASKRAETRQRILDAAGRLFRAHGVDGIGIDAVMREAGLTHGGFYLHFPSKEVLAAEVSHALLQSAAQRWEEVCGTTDADTALREIVAGYLDPERVAAGKCCLLTMLGPDVARRPASRGAIGSALRSMLGTLTRCLPNRRPEEGMAALSTMVGAVVLSRLADDPALSAAFLQAARRAVVCGDVAQQPRTEVAASG